MIHYINKFSLLLVLANLLTLPCRGEDKDDPFPSISVSGSAEVRVAPDQVVLTSAISSRAKNLADAFAENEQKIGKVMTFLKTSGVTSENVRTEFINIEPIFPQKEYSIMAKPMAQQMNAAPNAVPPAGAVDGGLEQTIEPIGYQVRRQFTIRISDLKTFEPIYKGLVENGVNNITGFQFESTELRKHRDDARLRAVRAAREKAEAMAKELGATLDSVHSIQETNDQWQPAFQNTILSSSGAGADDAGSFATGQISITGQVNVVFKLGNTKLNE